MAPGALPVSHKNKVEGQNLGETDALGGQVGVAERVQCVYNYTQYLYLEVELEEGA